MATAQDKADNQKIRYVAIGDSYSIGEGASPAAPESERATRRSCRKSIRHRLDNAAGDRSRAAHLRSIEADVRYAPDRRERLGARRRRKNFSQTFHATPRPNARASSGQKTVAYCHHSGFWRDSDRRALCARTQHFRRTDAL